MRKKRKEEKAEGRKENSGSTWLSGCVSPLLYSSWNTNCIPTAHWMPVLEPPKALVRAKGIPEPLSSKVIEGWSIPTADVSTCDDLSLVACLPSRSLSRDRPQTQVFIPHGKQTQRTEAVSGGHRLESPGDRRTLAPCSWSQCLLVLRDPREEPHLPTRRPGYRPPRLFAWGGLSLCFR